MTLQRKTVHVRPGSELDCLLDQAAGDPLVVERDGKLYRLEPVDVAPNVPESSYDPERVRQALQATAGALRGVDIDALLADLRTEREQDSRGRPA